MKHIIFILSTLLCIQVHAQVTLDANGNGETYDLITNVLAPGYNPIEVPDCNHVDFGNHIDEIYDNELGIHVFRFFIHVDPDNDRCIKFDRQRNEIKTYDKSPDNLLGTENEKVVYKWKFKLDSAFQSSPNFTHIHQLKSVGGEWESIPMYTLTTRKGSPDRLELRYAETDDQITLIQKDIDAFLDTWVSVTETITYSTNGSYAIEINRVSDGENLLSYSTASIINWRPGATFVRPKWGIYRSLINAQDLRDESILYANFSIEELIPNSTIGSNHKERQSPIVNNPINNTLRISQLPLEVQHIYIYGLDGKLMLKKNINRLAEIEIDVSTLSQGLYILQLKGQAYSFSRKIYIQDE